MRIVLAAPFLLLFPGYALLAAVFPRGRDLGGMERLVYSCISSVGIVVLAGVVLERTIGFRFMPVLCSVAGLVFLSSGIAAVRLALVAKEDRLRINLGVRLGGLARSWSSLALLILILASFAAAGLIAAGTGGENYTAFYVLGEQGRAGDYVQTLTAGEENRAVLGITNHESQSIEYRIEVWIGETLAGNAGPVQVESGETWEGEVSFTAAAAGPNRKVEFLLFKGSESVPCKTLHYWTEIVEQVTLNTLGG